MDRTLARSDRFIFTSGGRLSFQWNFRLRILQSSGETSPLLLDSRRLKLYDSNEATADRRFKNGMASYVVAFVFPRNFRSQSTVRSADAFLPSTFWRSLDIFWRIILTEKDSHNDGSLFLAHESRQRDFSSTLSSRVSVGWPTRTILDLCKYWQRASNSPHKSGLWIVSHKGKIQYLVIHASSLSTWRW